MKNFSVRARLIALAASTLLALPAAQAHRLWLLPSTTVISDKEAWVTFDAAVSNDIFYFEHNPAATDGLVITAPDGQPVQPENLSKGHYRTVFDIKLGKEGTYRAALVNDAVMASYKVGNEMKRVRAASTEALAKDIPADAQELRVSQSQNRVETFVTLGKPSKDIFKPTGRGIELVPVTHPNDLVTGSTATFRFLDNGKPAVGYPAIVILAGLRYRSELGEIKLTTDAKGEIQVKWPSAGMYWLNVTPPGAPREGGGPGAGGPGGMPGGPGGPGAGEGPRMPSGPAGTLAAPIRRSSYSVTLEVLSD